MSEIGISAVAPARQAKTGRPIEVDCDDAKGGAAGSAGNPNLQVTRDGLRAVFGVDDPAVAQGLLSQLVNTIRPDCVGSTEATAKDFSLALIQGIDPKGVAEAMTATLLTATYCAAMETMRLATHSAQTPGGRNMYMSLSMKAARTYAQLLEAFNHGRGKGLSQQRITVEHVHVEAGGQAVVGGISTGRG